jgi:hypothetical protein
MLEATAFGVFVDRSSPAHQDEMTCRAANGRAETFASDAASRRPPSVSTRP